MSRSVMNFSFHHSLPLVQLRAFQGLYLKFTLDKFFPSGGLRRSSVYDSCSLRNDLDMKSTWQATSCQNCISIQKISAAFSHAAKDWNSSLAECLQIHDINVHPFQVCIQMRLDNYVAAAISVRNLTCLCWHCDSIVTIPMLPCPLTWCVDHKLFEHIGTITNRRQ